jgi:23S rRNA (adenine2503-C2)-methyltransferase
MRKAKQIPLTPLDKGGIKNMNREELQALMESWGQRPFHGRQIFAGLFKRAVSSVEEMTDLPLRLREKLLEFEPLDLLRAVGSLSAEDGTIKTLFEANDGARIESVWMPEATHAVQCLSTQVGCPLECTFCATGMMGFKRNLTSGEIVDQVIHFRRLKSSVALRNLVFMGMGEPLLNYRNVVKAVRILSAPDSTAISQRRMTISTAGIVPGIRKLAEEGLGVKLAVSLNAPTDELRDRLMPINRKYPIAEVMKAAKEYQRANSNHRITFEYALMPGINDTTPLIRALRNLLVQLPSKLNLIPLNPIDKKAHREADWDSIFDRFYRVFEKERVVLTLRRSRGQEIQAACGQLASRNLTQD